MERGCKTLTLYRRVYQSYEPELSGARQPRFDLGGSGRIWIGDIVALARKARVCGRINPERQPPWVTQVGREFASEASSGAPRVMVSTFMSRSPITIIFTYTLVPSGHRSQWGSWSALDVALEDPLQIRRPTAGTIDTGSVSGCKWLMMRFLFRRCTRWDTEKRKNPMELRERGSVIDGPSIVDGVVYWGSVPGLSRPELEITKCTRYSAGSKDGDDNSQGGQNDVCHLKASLRRDLGPIQRQRA